MLDCTAEICDQAYDSSESCYHGLRTFNLKPISLFAYSHLTTILPFVSQFYSTLPSTSTAVATEPHVEHFDELNETTISKVVNDSDTTSETYGGT